jgi:hypothetical protein
LMSVVRGMPRRRAAGAIRIHSIGSLRLVMSVGWLVAVKSSR